METLHIAEHLLLKDLEEYAPRVSPKAFRRKTTPENDSFQQQDFFRYLVSVASHSIGLRASVKPFNSTEEDMLSYLVDAFGIKDFSRLKKILLSYKDSDAERDRVDQIKLARIIRSRRRHSWRPELRIRLTPPIFYYRERHYIDNLNVRVYLFKQSDTSKTEEADDDVTQTSKNQRAVLNSIFRIKKIDSSSKIRPVEEMRCLIKFERVTSPNQDSPADEINYKMVKFIDRIKSEGDICLKIRRRYCEPGSRYILRFEFWLNSEAVEANWTVQYRRYLKRFVYNGTSPCAHRRESIYQNEDQEFYGYVNYKLDQLPSYAIKLNLPIITLQNRRINNCEIFIEAKNRRLESGHKMTTQPVGTDSARSIPNQDFLINHIRLYVNCFLYQSLKLIKSRGDSLIGSYAMENITIDNLFYNPAQTLINQHRLQSNLNITEDQSLRRIAFLLLLNGLQSKFGCHEKDVNLVLNLLISLTKNEYTMVRKITDNKTLQRLDSFVDDVSANKERELIEMEMTMVRRFALNALQDWVKRYFLPSIPKDDLKRNITLNGLAMFKRALIHHERFNQTRSGVKNIKFDVVQLRGLISGILRSLVERYFSRRFVDLLTRDTGEVDQGNEQRRKGIKPSELDSWPELLRDIRGLNNDLYLYWSTRGIESFKTIEDREFRQMNTERQNLEKVIKLKIDDFLD